MSHFLLNIRPFFFVGFILMHALLNATISLYNNSSYPLIAKIYAAQGDLLTTLSLSPGEKMRWDHDQSNYDKQYNVPYTPYTVRWYCNTGNRPFDYSTPNKKNDSKQQPPEYASEYAVWPHVPPGATITAQQSPQGNHSCVVKKNENNNQVRPTQAPTPQRRKQTQPQKKDQIFQGDFKNDGGENWDNDGASPFQSGKQPSNNFQGDFKNDGGENWDNDGASPFENKESNSSSNSDPNRWKND